MNKKRFVLILIVVGLLSIGGGVYYYQQQQKEINTPTKLKDRVQQTINESKEINKDPSTSSIKTSYDILVQAGKANDNKTVEKYILNKDLQVLISDDKKFTESMKFLSNLTNPTDLMKKENLEGVDNIFMITHLLIDGSVGATCGLPFVQENGIWKLHYSFIICN